MVKLAFNKVTLTGFTNEEAAKFIDEKKEFREHKDKVLEIGGTNPHLLSLCEGCTNFTDYSHSVDFEVQEFLENNLTIFKDVKSVSECFSKCKWETGRQYIYIVLQDEEFTSKQLEGYQTSWLCDNQLLVDVGDNKKKFNFPTLGKE